MHEANLSQLMSNFNLDCGPNNNPALDVKKTASVLEERVKKAVSERIHHQWDKVKDILSQH